MDKVNINSVKVKDLLAQYIGVEVDDIDNDDSFISDLHMKPTDITDFIEILAENGIDVSKINLSDIDTVDDLIEEIGINDYLN